MADEQDATSAARAVKVCKKGGLRRHSLQRFSERGATGPVSEEPLLDAGQRWKWREALIDYRDWGVPLGRRFRALKLWFVIRAYGIEKLQAMLRQHIALAHELAAQIAAAPDFELTTPANLALLTFRYRPPGPDEPALDRLNERLLHALNDSGRVYLTQTRCRGRYVIRFAIGQRTTSRNHVQRAWQLIQQTAQSLASEAG
jgi:glutamate/tyrosine decarboxylase-like PLP-dependent enzyme